MGIYLYRLANFKKPTERCLSEGEKSAIAQTLLALHFAPLRVRTSPYRRQRQMIISFFDSKSSW